MINWEKIRREWETTNITLKALAEKYGVKHSTLRSRKSREKWQRNATKNIATQKRNVATPEKKVAAQEKSEDYPEEPVIENDELTDKQRLFCLYYLKYFNATKAYQKAYGCSYSTAMVNGNRLLRNAKVSAELDRLKAEQAQGLKLDAKAVLQKYIDIAFADITDFVEFGREERTDEFGNPYETNVVKFKESTEVDGTIITEVRKGKDGVSVKLADKMKALEFLSKYTDLLSENNKKRLEEEKLKAEIAKLNGENNKNDNEDWIAAIHEVAKKRKGMMKNE